MGWGVVRTKIGFPLRLSSHLPAIVYTSMPDVFHGGEIRNHTAQRADWIALAIALHCHCIVSLRDIEKEFVVLSLLWRDTCTISLRRTENWYTMVTYTSHPPNVPV